LKGTRARSRNKDGKNVPDAARGIRGVDSSLHGTPKTSIIFGYTLIEEKCSMDRSAGLARMVRHRRPVV
jgi:hypothetical protein